MEDFKTKDYELVRTELRHFQRNQLTILSILVTASVTAYAYSIDNREKLVIVSGFIIPILFATLGTLWIDQIYRQRELALYSFLLENELSTGMITHGWEHYVQNKRSKKRVLGIKQLEKIKGPLEKILNAPSLYYYSLMSIGVVLVPILSVGYSFMQVSKISPYTSSRIYILGPFVIIIQIIIELMYLINIHALQLDLTHEVRLDKQRREELYYSEKYNQIKNK